MKKILTILLSICLALALLSACQNTNRPDDSNPSGGSDVANTDNSSQQSTQVDSGDAKPSDNPIDEKPIGSAKEFMLRVQNAGYLVEDKHAIKADGLVDGFVMLYPTDDGSWYIPVLEFESEQTAAAYAGKFDQSITIAYTDGKFVFAMNVEPDIPAEEIEAD